MIAKIFNIAMALLFAVLSSVTCLHGFAAIQFKVVIAAVTLFFIMAELALYYLLGRLVTGNTPDEEQPESLKVVHRETPVVREENSLGKLLSQLPPPWIVLKNFYRNGVDADFVVIGLTGIHLINVKDVRGTIEKSETFLILNNKRLICDFIANVKDQADELQKDFRSFGKTGSVIKPVLCFSNAHLSRGSAGRYDEVLVTSTQSIIDQITGDNQVLNSFDVYGVYTVLCRNSVFRKLSTHNPFNGGFSGGEPNPA